MMRRRRRQLRTMYLVHSLIEAGLVLHRRTHALVAVAIVFLPFRRDKSLLRWIRRKGRGVLRSEPLLSRDRAAAGRRSDHVAILANADGNIADVDRDLAALGITQRLRQRPDVVVRESQRLDLREFRVLRKRRQSHPETFKSVVQGVHSVTFAVVRLYSPVPLQSQHLLAENSHRSVLRRLSCEEDDKTKNKKRRQIREISKACKRLY